jgi:hypothetical protein
MNKTRWISLACKDDGVENEGGEAGTGIVITRRVVDRVMISLALLEAERRARGSTPSLKAGISVMIHFEDFDR